MPTLLLIDDEDAIRFSFRHVFADDATCVLTAATAAEGMELLRRHNPDVVVLDLQLPDRSGLDVFHDVHTHDPRTPVIFITAHGTSETALQAMKSGAFDYLVKPIDLDRLSSLLARAFEAARLMRVPAVLPDEDRADRIVGSSPAVQEMCKAIGRVAPQDVNVLILGESGSGKELVARAIYHHSRRADMPFLAINCAAIPEALLESELFGHEKGAFTGADQQQVDKFEQYDSGTLLLDEIGDMPPPLQAKMLRVLEDQRFQRLGGVETLQTRVRVLAATNQDLARLVEEGRFRKDLYYRLKVVTISVPPLRDRPGDVAELAQYFLTRFNRELGLDLRAIAAEALELLEAYPWPGNVRELQSALKEAMVRNTGHILLPEFLPPEVRRQPPAAPAPPVAVASGQSLEALVETLLADEQGEVYSRAVQALEQVLLPRVLQQVNNSQVRASERLGISRGTLRQRLRALGLTIDRVINETGEA
jgi:DNA-binding NtrC family response regulator